MRATGFSVGRTSPARWVRFFAYSCPAVQFAVTALGFAVAAVWPGFPLAVATAQESPYDYAEIYVDRYFNSEAKLDLSAAGAAKSHALALYTRGLAAEQRGDDTAAAQIFAEVLEILPNEADLSKRVAYLLAQNGETGKALEVLEKFLADNTGKVAAYLNLSEFLATYHSGDEAARDRAIEIAEQAEQKFPDSARVYDHLVKLYIVARRRADAESVVQRALERDVKRAGYWLTIASITSRVWPPVPGEGANLERLNRAYAKALEFGGDNLAIEVRVASFYHASRQLEKARDLFLDILKRYPESLDVRNSLAEVYAALGDADRVVETLSDLAQINPQDLTAQKRLARIYLNQAQSLQDQLALDPSLRPALEEKIDRAIEHFQNAFEVAKGTPEEYIQVASLLLNRRRAGDAVEVLKRAIFYYPDMPELEQQLAYSFSVDDRHGLALPHFERSVVLFSQEDPDRLDAEFYFQFGAAAEQTKDFDRAETLFKKSMALLAEDDPESERNKWLGATLYNYLGYMWLERDRNIDEAGELIAEAYRMNSDSGAIADSMGWFYFKKGRYAEAKKELIKAEGLMEEPDSTVYDHLAQTVFQLGDKPAALKFMRRAIELDPDNEEFVARLKELESKEAPAVKPVEAEAEAEADGEKKEAPENKPELKPGEGTGQGAKAA